jgi:capsular exopolysaccharide synthesis family protein
MEQPPQSAQLKDYVAVVRHRLVLVLVITAVFTALAGVYAFTRPAVYESSAQVLVQALSNDITDSGTLDMATEAEIAASPKVTDLALQDPSLIDFDLSPETFPEGLHVSAPADSQVLEFAYTAGEPVLALRAARAYANAYLDYRVTTLQTRVQAQVDALDTQKTTLLDQRRADAEILANADPDSGQYQRAQSEISLIDQQILQLDTQTAQLLAIQDTSSVIGDASDPVAAGTPKVMILLAGLMLGLFFGVVTAFLLEGLSGRVRHPEEIEADLGTPVLGSIPAMRTHKGLVTRDYASDPGAEAYRVLRSALLFKAPDTHVFMVTSAGIGDGKSTTAANLATSLAQADNTVILVAADLRRPSLHQYFGIDAEDGLAQALLNGTRPPLLNTDVRGLYVIPSGAPVQASAFLFETGRFESIIADARDQADYVVVDAPPLAISDPVLMAPYVEGLLLVVDSGSATRGALKRTREMLARIGAPPIGAVLNRQKMGAKGYGYYRYDYRYAPKSAPKSSRTKLKRVDKDDRTA